MSIKIKNITYNYIDKSVLNDISFEVRGGEFWGVLGKNGAGKTTLIDLILGVKSPSSGSISLNGKSPNDISGEHLKNVAYLSQDIRLKSDITVRDFLEFYSFNYPNYSKERERELIESLELDYSSQVGSLSTGQQMKVQVVGAFSSEADVILIDEITAVLDPETRYLFFSKLLELKKSKERIILLATNIVEDLEGRVDSVYYIHDHQGKIVNPNELKDLFKRKV